MSDEALIPKTMTCAVCNLSWALCDHVGPNLENFRTRAESAEARAARFEAVLRELADWVDRFLADDTGDDAFIAHLDEASQSARRALTEGAGEEGKE